MREGRDVLEPTEAGGREARDDAPELVVDADLGELLAHAAKGSDAGAAFVLERRRAEALDGEPGAVLDADDLGRRLDLGEDGQEDLVGEVFDARPGTVHRWLARSL